MPPYIVPSQLKILIPVGTPTSIVETAKKLKVDLIIMATHGRTGLTHLLMGSVTEHVVRSATCPVLTLRAGKVARRKTAKRKQRS